MRVWAGDCLVPLKADLEYQVAVYSPMPDPQYIYTYSYPPEANLTKFCPDKSVVQWKTGPCLFPEAAYIGLVAGSDFGQIFITDTDPVRIHAIVDRLTEDRAYFNAAGGVFTRVEKP